MPASTTHVRPRSQAHHRAIARAVRCHRSTAMATAPVKIVVLAAAVSAAVALSFFYRFRCVHLPTPYVPGGGRRLIVVSNQQEVGEEMDLADGNVQLLCHGYGEHDHSRSVWSARADIPAARRRACRCSPCAATRCSRCCAPTAAPTGAGRTACACSPTRATTTSSARSTPAAARCGSARTGALRSSTAPPPRRRYSWASCRTSTTPGTAPARRRAASAGRSTG